MKTNDAKNGHIRVPLVQGDLETRTEESFGGRWLFQLLDWDLDRVRYINWIKSLPKEEQDHKYANYDELLRTIDSL